jgi:tetratricopeptide (TPR) repeat protein
MKKTLLPLLLAGSLCFSLQAQLPAERQAAETQQTQLGSPNSEDLRLKLQPAAVTQEIILALLADHDYEAVYPEFEKLLALGLEGELEGLLAEATWVIVGELRQNSQFSLAHKILDSTLRTISERENKYSLLILKGQTFRDQGRNRDAVRTYREALKYQD